MPEVLPPRPEPLSESEGRLQALCAATFLRLWSYPGVYRDQGSAGGRHGGKEVCDLLVVFENHVIIFSDKTCAFPPSAELQISWRRWYDRAIRRSAKQLRGAERWIRAHPDRLFLDRLCKVPFPYPLPSQSTARFHRIVVAGGAGARCRAELGGTGSLMLQYGPVGANPAEPPPFTVGRPDHQPGMIHVFDDFTLETVLATLDTITDFVGYLGAKEALLESGKAVMAAGEEELLARYLTHAGPDGGHSFAIPDSVNGAWFDEGSWIEFAKNPQRLAQLEADEISYAWDRLIDRFTHFTTTGGTEYSNFTKISEFERATRFMAREPRTKRRMLSKALLENMSKARPGTERATRIGLPTGPGDPYYVFLALHPLAGKPREQYRTVRRNLLEALCMAVRARWDDARDIIGIATDPLQSDEMSEDLAYVDGRQWSEASQLEAERRACELGLLKDIKLRQTHAKEYPDLPNRAVQPARRSGLDIGRNDPCPCRSGRKFKKCCGRPGR